MLRKLRFRQKNGFLIKQKTCILFFKFYHNFVITFSEIIVFGPLLLNGTNSDFRNEDSFTAFKKHSKFDTSFSK